MEQIDVVIPWVDSHDYEWLNKKNKYSGEKESEFEYESDNRFRDYGTLRYVLRSIEVNMPWIRRVYLVTDNQTPIWVNTSNVVVVDHTDIIDGVLPTFNSNTILTSVYKISSMAEKFIIFNDDVLAWKKMYPKQFFRNGRPVDMLIETGTVPESDGFFHISQNDVAEVNRLFQKRDVQKSIFLKIFNFRYGLNVIRNILSLPYGGFIGFLNPHLAMAYTKDDFENANRISGQLFRLTWSHRFRTSDDINEWLVRYIRNLNGRFSPGRVRGRFMSLGNFKDGIPQIRKSDQMIVINDDGNRDDSVFENVEKLLSMKFPKKSKYEN